MSKCVITYSYEFVANAIMVFAHNPIWRDPMLILTIEEPWSPNPVLVWNKPLGVKGTREIMGWIDDAIKDYRTQHGSNSQHPAHV